MSERLTIRCPACQAEYDLPSSFHDILVGKSISCEGCGESWVPLEASGWLAKLKRVQALPIDLTPYRKDTQELGTELGEASAIPAPGAPRPQEPTPGAPLLEEPAPAPQTSCPAPEKTLSLRVLAYGPELDLDRTYDLGPRSFLIGRHGCHLDLPQASIPDRAVRIRTASDQLAFEGLGDFTIPLHPVSVKAGHIKSGASLTLRLDPYQMVLETTEVPGEPIADHQENAPPVADLRAQLDNVPGAGATPEIASAYQTVRDLGAQTFASQSRSHPLEGLEVSFVGIEGRFKRKSYRVRKSQIVIGRTTGDLVIPDELISGKHAQLEVVGPDLYSLKDFASTNGTTVNGRPISVAALHDGDIVGFGDVKFKFVARPGGN